MCSFVSFVNKTSERYRSVISYLMHQCDEEDEDELTSLNHAWKLLKLCSKQGADGDNKEPPKSTTFQRLFVPINDQYAHSKSCFAIPGGGSHWSLLIWDIVATSYSDFRSNKLHVESMYYHFDSSSGYNASAAKAVSVKLHKVLCCVSSSIFIENVDLKNPVECTTPQQTNGYDCGVFMLAVAGALSCDGSGENKEEFERTIRTYFDGMGDNFALTLRKQIADNIRQLSDMKDS